MNLAVELGLHESGSAAYFLGFLGFGAFTVVEGTRTDLDPSVWPEVELLTFTVRRKLL